MMPTMLLRYGMRNRLEEKGKKEKVREEEERRKEKKHEVCITPLHSWQYLATSGGKTESHA